MKSDETQLNLAFQQHVREKLNLKLPVSVVFVYQFDDFLLVQLLGQSNNEQWYSLAILSLSEGISIISYSRLAGQVVSRKFHQIENSKRIVATLLERLKVRAT